MDARTLNVKAIFGQDRRHMVPLFQRPYVWTRKEQWEPLWEDVRRMAEAKLLGEDTRSHFLGAIVLDQMRRPTGHLECRLVIDGQQRLTTLQLLMEAFCDLCQMRPEVERYQKALLKLTRNDDPMSADPDEQFKVWPTTVDQDPFRLVMNAANPAAVCRGFGYPGGTPSVGHPIADAYLYFFEAISEWAEENEDVGRRIEALYEILREHVRMVVIDLGEQDDAQMIFESLNARGTPLLPADLVKNFLFHQAHVEGKPLVPLYDKYWSYFDDAAGSWRKEIGRGHAKRHLIDIFMMHYLTCRTLAEVPVGMVYSRFRDYGRKHHAGEVEGLFRDLLESARIYARFHDPAIEKNRESMFFKRMRDMDIITVFPFLLAIYGDKQIGIGPEGQGRFCAASSEEEKNARRERVQILQDIESFLVRRMICHQLNTRGYGKLFLELIRVLQKASEPAAEIRRFLLRSSAESMRWPRDAEFGAAWLSVPVFRSLTRGRVRMLLEALEREIRTDKSETIVLDERLQIEHLLPQEWHKNWPLPGDVPHEAAEAERSRVLHTVGNLTLVTEKLNPALSNGKWLDKREAILAHSALGMNRRLSNFSVWSDQTIGMRGKELFALAERIWPIPDGA